MGNIAIKAEGISKAYQLGEFSTGTLSRDIERWWTMLRGKEDPFLRIGETNDRTSKGQSDIVWSLKDIDFEIQQGDAVGIIGRNGAGKSTLLKVLSRVTTPTSGNVKIKGRIASLLEVGTGFHPELTGRENIFLNGAILGMRKTEIKKHFDAIVDFAGVERYIDTPVKRYSSGMYVRLAFAVAAYLESEILIVDEVLAVGDAEFQKKCLGKMSDASKGEGKTVLFVSHNMVAVNSLCNRSILLKNGMIEDFDYTRLIVDKYISSGMESIAEVGKEEFTVTKKCSIADFFAIRLISRERGVTSSFEISEDIIIEFEYEITQNNSIISPSIHILDDMETCVLASFNGPSATLGVDTYYGKILKKGRYKSTCVIPANFLNDKTYIISAFLVPQQISDIGIVDKVISFTVLETTTTRKDYTGGWMGVVRPKMSWKTIPL